LNRKYPDLAPSVQFRLFGVYDSFEPLLEAPVSLLFDDDLGRLRRVLARAQLDHEPKIIVLFDEIERLLPVGRISTGFEGYLDFLGYWRGQAQQHRDLVTVITGANPTIAERSQWEGIDNPVYRFYEEQFLPSLDYGECSSMVRELGVGMGVRYTDKALQDIFALTGGHPFIARQLCSRICQRRPARPLVVNDRTVRDTLPDFLQGGSNLFDEILDRLDRDFPEELMILKYIAQHETVTRGEVRELVGRDAGTVLHHLVGYQLVDQTDHRYRISIDLLQSMLQPSPFEEGI
jgi:hypothetical protein